MEIPDLVTQRLGDETVTATVPLGDEDVACFTPTRTLIYSGEGLLSDESVDVYDHDIERLAVSEGRRKTKFTLEYVDRTEKFAIGSAYTERVLENLIDGILGVSEILDEDESVSGVYRFSELTLIITDKRLVKHIGNMVWDDDFEEYSFADVTALSFEEGSVATQIILSVDGRPQRIKAPNDEVPMLKRTLTEVVCAYHDVQSLGELNAAAVGSETADEPESPTANSGFTLDEDITPLVGESDAEREQQTDPLATPDSESEKPVDETATTTESNATEPSPATDTTTEAGREQGTTRQESPRDESHLKTVEQRKEPVGAEPTSQAQSNASQPAPEPAIDPAEFKQLQEQVATLTTAVQRQNELLRQQHETIQRLLEKQE